MLKFSLARMVCASSLQPIMTLFKMNIRVFLSIPLFLFNALTGIAQLPGGAVPFDSGWKFFNGDPAGAEQISFDDRPWRQLDLPHDWSIEDLPGQSDTVIGPFSKNSIGNTATGYTVGGTGWYRKHFNVDHSAGKKISIYFDGVYMNSDVWINGHYLGNHPYGYTPFYYDITNYINPSGDNLIAVCVRNEGKNSRWYTGSGIYRHVWLVSTNAIHTAFWGVSVTTPEVSVKHALVNIKTTVVGEKQKVALTLVTSILDAKKKVVSKTATDFSLNGITEVTQNFTVGSPSLWSPDSPDLYQAITEIKQGKKQLGRVVTDFGIRSIVINAQNGLLLNGKAIKLRGGCIHNDNGPLGSATIDRAEERKVELLKKNGFNAVRTSHNPPSAQFLDACDRLGMIVIDELFDMWQLPKNPLDYHLYFDKWWKKDLNAVVMRDRNHPSVFFWSIGNEINERVAVSGLAIEKLLADEVKRLDKTRPVTEAISSFWDHPDYKWDTTAAAFSMLDVGGYNYMWKQYEADHKKYPERVMMGTESYPREALTNWNLVEKHPYVLGDFVWTAMDYLGETGLGHTSLDPASPFLQTFPWFNAWCGDIDLIGDKKPQMYYRDIVWRTASMHMLVHKPIPTGKREHVSYWGWQDEVPYYYFPGREGELVTVNIYTRAQAVRLELNGKEVGQQKVQQDNLTASFTMAYQPGTLKAISLENGHPVDSVILTTPGKPAKIRLTADRPQITSGRNDLVYVTAEVLDENGRVVPEGEFTLHFAVAGQGEIAAIANASPNDMQRFKNPVQRTFRGKCLVILRPDGKPGKMTLNAGSNGLTGQTITVNVK